MKPYRTIYVLLILAVLVGASFFAIIPKLDDGNDMINSDPQDSDDATIADPENKPGTDNSEPAAKYSGYPIPTNYFVENVGQHPDSNVRFYGIINNVQIAFSESTVSIIIEEYSSDIDGLSNTDKVKVKGVMLRMTFEGANAVQPQGNAVLSHNSNYFIGNEPNTWYTDVPNYDEIIYENLYDGIDLVYYTTDDGGIEPDNIVVTYEGASGLSIDNGDLIVHTDLIDLRDTSPYSYQDPGEVVDCQFNILSENSYGFSIDSFDTTKTLTIDPLVYATYLGGNHQDYTLDIAVDSSGNAYVTGPTWYNGVLAPLPTTAGAYDTTHNGGVVDAFVVKLNDTGGGLVYSTFLGGSSGEDGFGIVIDSTGNAYITGRTQSTDFPTTAGAFDTTFNGASNDAFITKLNAAGSSLVFSTYVGGSSDDQGREIAVDSAGNTYITGLTMSSNFPKTTGAYDTTFNGGAGLRDAFVAKLNASGSSLDYGTFLGGNAHDAGVAITVDSAGNAYVTGETESFDFPNTTGAFDNNKSGHRDAWVTKLNPSGSSLVYSTFFGGSLSESGEDIVVDSAGCAYLTGLTGSNDLPNTTGAYDTSYNGNNDGYVAKFNAAGSALVFSTYLGGTGQDWGRNLFLADNNSVYLAAAVLSTDYPTTPGTYDNTSNGGQDVIVAKLDPTGSSLLYSTYLGGSGGESPGGIAVDSNGDAYVTGYTNSNDFPVTPNAYDKNFSNGDGFVAKLSIGLTPGNVTPADDLVDAAEDIIDYIDSLDPGNFSNPNHKKTLINKMEAVIKQIENGDYCSAINKLTNDILPKTDGEHPPPDWVTDPVSQQTLEDMILDLIADLEAKAAASGGCP
jgi:hypothetical protein